MLLLPRSAAKMTPLASCMSYSQTRLVMADTLPLKEELRWRDEEEEEWRVQRGR